VSEFDAQSLRDLLGRRPSGIELDRVALEIARIECPQLDAEACLRELDRLAFAIAERAHDLSDGQHFVEAANKYLFEEAGFRGNNDNYYDPVNSCLNRVLEIRQGIPITLSLVYIEVARRLAKNVTGVGLPRHFIVRYDDRSYSALIDPFDRGRILTMDDCCRLAQAEEVHFSWLQSVDKRAIAIRMLNNMRGVYFTRREPAKALQVLDLLIEAEPNNADEHKQRAAVLLQCDRMPEAMSAFQRYLALAPKADDREQVEEQIRNITHWLASRN
jgi:regulator of sirC expression with transglutaminase-like and TPR domain